MTLTRLYVLIYNITHIYISISSTAGYKPGKKNSIFEVNFTQGKGCRK